MHVSYDSDPCHFDGLWHYCSDGGAVGRRYNLLTGRAPPEPRSLSMRRSIICTSFVVRDKLSCFSPLLLAAPRPVRNAPSGRQPNNQIERIPHASEPSYTDG